MGLCCAGNGRKGVKREREKGHYSKEKEKVRGVIIKVTHTPLNGSRLDHRQAGAMPLSDTKGCAGRGCHAGFN